MFLRAIHIQLFSKSKKSINIQNIKSIAFYLLRDKIRFFVFLLIIDLIAVFYIFNLYIVPVLNGSEGNAFSSGEVKKVRIKKDLYDALVKPSVKSFGR